MAACWATRFVGDLPEPEQSDATAIMGGMTSDARGTVSGTRFIIVGAVSAVAFVLFLVLVSPTLLERTQALAPPPAPHEIATGEIGDRPWTATATRAEQDTPCLRLELGADTTELCGTRRGAGVLQRVRLVDAGGGDALLMAVMTSDVGTLRVTPSDQETRTLAPVFVDYGYPAGFLAVALPGAALEITAVDRDGAVIATATCSAAGDCDTSVGG